MPPPWNRAAGAFEVIRFVSEASQANQIAEDIPQRLGTCSASVRIPANAGGSAALLAGGELLFEVTRSRKAVTELARVPEIREVAGTHGDPSARSEAEVATFAHCWSGKRSSAGP